MKKISNTILCWWIAIFGLTILVAKILNYETSNYTLKSILIILSIVIISASMIVGMILVTKVISKSAKKDSVEKNLSKIDFGKYKDYYRDILNEFNIIQLSYIDDYTIDKNTIAAALLDLERKKIIEINNNEIIILKENNLIPIEQYLIKNISNNKISINTKKLIRIIKKESKEILRKNNQQNLSIIDVIKYCVTLIFIAFLSEIFHLTIIVVIISFIYIFAPILAFFYAFEFNTNKLSHIRNELGNEINLKLEGLKNYINDFSILNEREKNELIIWDTYLIYAVLFNINKPAYKEIEKFIELK